MTGGRLWQVLIADLKSSRRIPARRRPLVDRAFRVAVARVRRLYGEHFRLAPQILRGDELQAVLTAGAPALEILTCLRAHLAAGAGRETQLRAGVGLGTIQRMSRSGPFASEGEAFHRARAALEHAKQKEGRLTSWQTGDPVFDPVSRTVLGLTDALTARWTTPQWEAVAGRLERKGLHAIAREKGVSFQSVSKRLRAASWNEVREAYGFLQTAARAATAPPAPPRPRVRPPEGETATSPPRG